MRLWATRRWSALNKTLYHSQLPTAEHSKTLVYMEELYHLSLSGLQTTENWNPRVTLVLPSHEEVHLPHMHLSQPVNNCGVIMVDISAAPVPSARFKLEMFRALQHAPLHPRFYSHSFLLPPPLREARCQPFSQTGHRALPFMLIRHPPPPVSLPLYLSFHLAP